MKLILTVILLTFLFGCEQTQTKSASKSADIVDTLNNKQIKVICLTQLN